MKEDAETRKWLRKQGEYRELYSSILQKHRGALQQQSPAPRDQPTDGLGNAEGGVDPFSEESELLSGIFRTEAKHVALGATVAAASLVSLRFLRSKTAVSTVFGRTKARALLEAEEEGRRLGTDAVQKSFANAVEGAFSLWVGYRTYDRLSHSPSERGPTITQYPTGSMEAIAALPLCRGRSRVSEALCPEWIAATNEGIPEAFWDVVVPSTNANGTNDDDESFRESRTWRAIRGFSGNCERRLAAERFFREEQSLPDDEPVVLPKKVAGADP